MYLYKPINADQCRDPYTPRHLILRIDGDDIFVIMVVVYDVAKVGEIMKTNDLTKIPSGELYWMAAVLQAEIIDLLRLEYSSSTVNVTMRFQLGTW